MWEILLHALIDTVKLLPILFLVYLLIELLEYRGTMRFENSKLLKSKASPVFGALFGCVPQCGFSVVSTELYAEKKISVGALVAVFIATSDEALPIMLANVEAIPALIALILVKIAMGIGIGYFANFLYKKLFGKNLTVKEIVVENHTLKESNAHINEHKEDNGLVKDEHSEEQEHKSVHSYGCCNHNIAEKKFDILHPILHCLKITAFILVVNIIFSSIVHLVGEQSIANFLAKGNAFQPLLAVLIGLIPNCASSLVITELYLAGGLTFGSIVAGLSVNAGLGLIVLLKENKSKKENLFIILTLIIPSLIIGYLLHFLLPLII